MYTNFIKFITLFIFIIFIHGVITDAKESDENLSSETCFSGYDGEVKHTYAATPYTPLPLSAMVEPPEVKDCTSEKIWMLVRHGTRNPSEKLVNLSKTALPILQKEIVESNETELCSDILSVLSNWTETRNYRDSKPEALVHEGRVEMRGIAARYKLRFPNLFDKNYSNTTYKIKSSNDDRSRNSALAFVETLFPDSTINKTYLNDVLKIDPVLTFFKNCSKWIHEVQRNSNAITEVKLFISSETYQSMLARMKKRLGFEQNLTSSMVELMYKTCCYESAATPKTPSPWCSVFDKQDALILEYVQDMSKYYRHGYGHKINYRPGCLLVKRIIGELQNHFDNPNSDTKAVLNFAHSGTMLPLLSRLGFFKDDVPLRSDNFPFQKRRQWKTRQMDTFAVNLAFILYKCPAEYVVAAYFDEVPIIIPGCNSFVCSYVDFKSNLSKFTQNCTMSSVCS